jgi:predicted ATPase
VALLLPSRVRRRLTALVNASSLARETPAVYAVEDAHWIDEVSESMLAEFLTVIPQTPSMMLLTYRPEYRGALTRVADAQTLALTPLSDSETAGLITELLGADPSVGASEILRKLDDDESLSRKRPQHLGAGR